MYFAIFYITIIDIFRKTKKICNNIPFIIQNNPMVKICIQPCWVLCY